MASFPVDVELAKDTHGHTQWAETERGNGNGSDILDEKSDQAKHHDELGDAGTKTTTNLNQHAHLGDDSDGHVAMTPKRFIAMLILCMSYVGAQLPLFFMGGCLTFIVEAVDDTAARGWATTSYGVALAAITPFTGYLQDLMGRRYIAIFGAVLACVGLAVIGSAHTFAQLLVGTVISGTGAGATELAAIAGLAELVSVKNRGYILSIMFSFIIPFAPYVLYSQLIATHSTWRWTMWLSLMWNGIVLVGFILFYFPKSHHRATGVERKQLLKEVDLVGGFLSISGIVLFLVGLQFGGNQFPWRSAQVIAPMVIGILLFILFVVWEVHGTKYPMVPGGMFKGQRVVGTSLAISFIIGMDVYAILNFLPLAFSTVYSGSGLQVGLKALGFAFGQTLGGVIGNVFMSSILLNYHKEWLVGSSVTMATFMTAMAAMNPTNPKLAIGLSTIAGFGVGGVLIPISTVALSACPDAYIGTVVALTNALRYLGGSIGYSIYYSIFTSKLTKKLPIYVATAAYKAGLPLSSIVAFVGALTTDPTKIALIPGVTPEIIAAGTKALQWAYSDSLKYVWYSSLPFGILCIIGSLVMEKNSRFITNRVAAALH